jgi:hypothetical protein
MHEIDARLNHTRDERLRLVAGHSVGEQLLCGGSIAVGVGTSSRIIASAARGDGHISRRGMLVGLLPAQQLHPEQPRLSQDAVHALLHDCAAVGHGRGRTAPPDGK